MLQGLGSPALAAVAIAGMMIVGRRLPVAEGRSVIDLHVLVTIAGALALGTAVTESGAAEAIAPRLVHGVECCPPAILPYVVLAFLQVLTVVFTETVTNNAVAAMLFPIGVATAAASNLSPRPFVMAVATAASMSFLTPIGYQTNLMVMGPGGYQPRDYLRAGWPLTLLVGVSALPLIPFWWPLRLPSPS